MSTSVISFGKSRWFTYAHVMDAVGSVRGRNEVARAAIYAARSGLSLGKLAFDQVGALTAKSH